MKTKEARVLARLYPGRSDLTAAEVDFARRAIEIASSESARTRLFGRDVRVGEEFSRRGIVYRCVLRPPVSELKVQECCSGCEYRAEGGGCDAPRCSSFTRNDRRNVWFKIVGEDE